MLISLCFCPLNSKFTERSICYFTLLFRIKREVPVLNQLRSRLSVNLPCSAWPCDLKGICHNAEQDGRAKASEKKFPVIFAHFYSLFFDHHKKGIGGNESDHEELGGSKHQQECAHHRARQVWRVVHNGNHVNVVYAVADTPEEIAQW